MTIRVTYILENVLKLFRRKRITIQAKRTRVSNFSAA